MFAALIFAALPPCDGAIAAAFDRAAIRAPRRGSPDFVAADTATENAIGESLSSLLVELEKRRPDYVRALERAALAGYELCEGDALLLFRPVKAGHGRPVFAIRRGAARRVIVEVPHTVFDYRTLEQGVTLFTELDARALIVAGTHRCASDQASSCDGASDVCGEGRGPFRASDMAHATDTIFHRAHRLLADHFREDVVVSLHGMDQRGVVLSDGTMIATSTTSLVVRLARTLGELAPKERVVLCSGLKDRRFFELCGTTNVQGRHLNGVEDACRRGATRSSGRFLHLEQSTRLRKRPDTLIEALKRLLPLDRLDGLR